MEISAAESILFADSFFSSPVAAAAVLLTVILIIIIGALAIAGFLNYRRTGSLLPTLPKLPR